MVGRASSGLFSQLSMILLDGLWIQSLIQTTQEEKNADSLENAVLYLLS